MKARKILISSIPGLFLISLFLVSCNKPVVGPKPEDPQGDPVLPSTPYDYETKHSVNSNYATLGRVLFYDRKLSVNDAVACGSCHKQEFAFANNTKFDRGFDGQTLTRNSPSIQGFKGFQNVSFNNFAPSSNNQEQVLLFWDGRQSNLSDMVLNPVLNHKEMNMPGFSELVQKLSAVPYYKQLFINAYGDETITKERIALALEAFVCCLNTKSSNVTPTVNTIPDFGQITTTEELGKFLFHTKYNCAQCHDPKPQNNQPPPGPYSNPVEPSIAMFNIGLDLTSIDKGLGALTGKPGDFGLFKVPTLQNIAFTAPYMHDGRFATLDQVLEHYSHNIKPNANLSPVFKNFDGSPKNLNILPAEKDAIIAFLKTLKNDDFLTSPMYSDPFKTNL